MSQAIRTALLAVAILIVTSLCAVLLSNAVMAATSTTPHIYVTAYNGVMTKGQVAVVVRALHPGANIRIAVSDEGVYRAKFLQNGVAWRYTVNQLHKAQYNLKIEFKNGRVSWIKSGMCKDDALHLANKRSVKATYCL